VDIDKAATPAEVVELIFDATHRWPGSRGYWWFRILYPGKDSTVTASRDNPEIILLLSSKFNESTDI
jgi:hypothetical protein